MFQNGYSVRCGAALGGDRFAVSISTRQIDEPMSIILQWTSGYSQPWFRADVPSEIYEILPSKQPWSSRFTFSALGADGVIYHVGQSTQAEDVWASLGGTETKGIDLLVGMKDISVGRAIFGQSSRTFIDGEGWTPLVPSVPPPANGNGIFEIKAIEDGPDGFVVGGRYLPENVLSSVVKDAYDTDVDLFVELLFREVKPESGFLMMQKAGIWHEIKLPFGGLIHCIHRLSDGRIIAGTSTGVVAQIVGIDEVFVLATLGTPEVVASIFDHGENVLLSCASGIQVLAADTLRMFEPPFDPGRGPIVDAVASEGILWVFGANSVGVFLDGKWTYTDIPDSLVNIPFTGLGT